MRKHQRVPPTTAPWPESRGESLRHRRLHQIALAQTHSLVEQIREKEKPVVGSELVKTYTLRDLGRTLRGLGRRKG